jgi:hypothetical protein
MRPIIQCACVIIDAPPHRRIERGHRMLQIIRSMMSWCGTEPFGIEIANAATTVTERVQHGKIAQQKPGVTTYSARWFLRSLSRCCTGSRLWPDGPTLGQIKPIATNQVSLLC